MALVGVDWGTTSLRAYLIEAPGSIIESLDEKDAGTLATCSKGIPAGEAFAGALDKLLARGSSPAWREASTPVLLCGMVGSRQGWLEAPYVPAPATLPSFAANVKSVKLKDGREAWIVPGLSCKPLSGGAPDVMRGEETQLFGALGSTGEKGLFILPGTHSKWALSTGHGELSSFETQMTGEVFNILKEHSILGKLMASPVEDWAAFEAGLARSGAPGGLLAHIFSCRCEGLVGNFQGSALPSYLSGILLGHELRDAARAVPTLTAATLIGSASLCERYQRAFRYIFSFEARVVPGDQAVARGLWSIWQEVRCAKEGPKTLARFQAAVAKCPLVAIIRGVKPSEAVAVGKALVEGGFTIMEVPLNSPEPFKSIELLAKSVPEHIVVGAGTVLTTDDVDRVANAGGTLIVSPNCDPVVIQRSQQLGLISMPGVATPTEAFAALAAGATGLKAFPGEQMPPKILKAWKAVLPKDCCLLVVGGITPENMEEYWSAGVNGFGMGSNIYKPGADPEDIKSKAKAFVGTFEALPKREPLTFSSAKRRRTN